MRSVRAYPSSLVFVWFLVLAPVLVSEVFKSPMIDLRVVTMAAAVPLIELVFDGSLFLHTLAAPVLAMVLVMMLRRGNRMSQRRWLGIPIGLFMHSLLDGSWQNASLFWWPLSGLGFSELSAPEVERSISLSLALDGVGLLVGFWAWKRYELNEPANRRLLLEHGRLSRRAIPN